MSFNEEDVLIASNKKMQEFAKKKVPMIGYCSPNLLRLSDKVCEIKIALSDKTKNHVDSMYFIPPQLMIFYILYIDLLYT